MRTQIIRLDRHDDVLSARDKMNWGKTARVVLVWPEKARILSSRLDIELLKRHSRSLGLQLAFVTRYRPAVENARLLGIPVFKTVEKAQKEPWETIPLKSIDRLHPSLDPGEYRTRQFSHNQRMGAGIAAKRGFRLLLFSISILSVLGMGIFFFPSAVIQIDPTVQNQEIQLSFFASPEAASPGISGQVPLQHTTLVVSGEDSLPATGKIMVADSPAQGTVAFTNLTGQSVDVPVGTVVLAVGQPPIRLETTQQGSVPAGQGENVDLPVKTIDGDHLTTIEAGQVQAIEGALGLSLAVSNAEPILKGTSHTDPAPSTADRETLRERLEASLTQAAIEKLQSDLGPGTIVVKNTVSVKDVLEETTQPAAGEPASRLDMTLRLIFDADYVTTGDLQTVARLVLDASLPDGYQASNQPISLEPLSEPQIQSDRGGKVSWQARATRSIAVRLADHDVIETILGKPVDQAGQLLTGTYNLQRAPAIQVSPAWWPWMPSLPFRIRVVR